MNLEKEPKMLAYHNDPVIKADILAQLQAHYDADEIVKGRYWQNGKGCAVGCTIYGNDHAEYERLFGIPRELAYLEDKIFESLPNSDAMGWPLRFMNAIAPGADLALVEPKFNRWVLHSIALPNAGADEAVGAAIRGTIAVLDGRIATGTANENARRTAYIAANSTTYDAVSAARAAYRAADSTAYSAAARSAYIAADSAAYSAASTAWSAAYSAASTAWSAADSTAYSAAYSAAWGEAYNAAHSAAWGAIADKLIELLETA